MRKITKYWLMDVSLTIKTFIFWKILGAKWIASTNHEGPDEFGFRICCVNFWYYKDRFPIISFGSDWRSVNYREFDEVIRPKVKCVTS